MKNTKIIGSFGLIIAAAVLLRLIPHMPNFAPVTGLALFSGAYLNKRIALIVPILIMIISDYLLLYIHPFGPNIFSFNQIYSPFSLVHSTTPYVWVSFMISALIGMWLKAHSKPTDIILASVAASAQFFLITNFGVWAEGSMYPKTVQGLMEAYIMGVPFFRNTMYGDLFYSTIFFGTDAFIRRKTFHFAF